MSRLQSVADRVRAAGANVEVVEADLTEDGSAKAVVDATCERFGHVTTLVNGAGIFELAAFPESLEHLDRQWAINVRGPYMLTHAVLPHFKPGGSILFLSSIGGLRGFSNIGAYCARDGRAGDRSSAIVV